MIMKHSVHLRVTSSTSKDANPIARLASLFLFLECFLGLLLYSNH